MTFTNTPPTVPGFYVWRLYDGHIPEAVSVLDLDGRLMAHAGRSQIDVQRAGGEWCRLVPADEVGKAFAEGLTNGKSQVRDYPPIDYMWDTSRAKRVMEGRE